MDPAGDGMAFINCTNPRPSAICTPLPTPEEICQNPLRFLDQASDRVAALTYRTGFKPSHQIGSGASARDRDHLLNWVAGNMPPNIELVKHIRGSISNPEAATQTSVRDDQTINRWNVSTRPRGGGQTADCDRHLV